MKWLPQKEDGLFTFGLILIHLVFFAWQLSHNNSILQDSDEYLYASQNIIDHNTLYAGDLSETIDPALYTKRPVGYPLFLALFLSFGSPIAIILLFQNVISILSLFLCRKLFSAFGYSKKFDFLALMLIAITPSQFIYANMIMAETLLQFLIVIIAFCLYGFSKNLEWKWLISLQVVLCFALLVKPVMYAWFIPNTFLLLIFFSKKVKPGLLISIALPPLLVIGAVMMRNHKLTSDYSYSSIQSINLVYYNAHFFNTKLVGMENADEEIATLTADVKELPYQQKWDTLRQWAFSKLSSAPFSYGVFHLRGMMTFFADPGRFDLYEFFEIKGEHYPGMLYYFSESGVSGVMEYLKRQNVVVVFGLLFIALVNVLKLLLALIYFIKTPNKPITIWYIALLIAFIAFATGPLGAARFAVPIVPFLTFMSVLGIIALTTFNKPLNKPQHKS